MIFPDGYQRSSLYFQNQTGRPLNDTDAQQMIDSELAVTVHDVVLHKGIVTNAVVVDHGRRLQLTIESGGRSCWACGAVFTLDHADRFTAALSSLREQMPGLIAREGIYDHLPDWVRVCREPATCQRRRFDVADADHDGEPDTPAQFVYDRFADCGNCPERIFHDGMLWRHDDTKLIPCRNNVTNATPKDPTA